MSRTLLRPKLRISAHRAVAARSCAPSYHCHSLAAIHADAPDFWSVWRNWAG